MSTTLPGVSPEGRLPALARPSARIALPLLCLLLPLLPFLAAPVFPTQDGPAHLGTAERLALIRAGQAPLAAGFLQEHDPGLTNLAAPWFLSRLLEVMPPVQAEWSMALALTLLLLVAVLLALWLLRGQPADAALGALLCAPLMLHMGSFSLVLGTACGFAALAFAARHGA